MFAWETIEFFEDIVDLLLQRQWQQSYDKEKTTKYQCSNLQ